MPARAGDGPSPVPADGVTDLVEVRLGRSASPWAIEGREGAEHCAHDCVLRLPPGRYRVSTGELKETIVLRRPTAFEASPGWSEGRSIGGVTALVGLGSSVITGLVALGYCPRETRNSSFFSVTTTNPCGDLSPTTRRTWFFISATGFALGVAGAFLHFLSGPHINASDIGPVPEPKHFPTVVVNTDPHGAYVAGQLQF